MIRAGLLLVVGALIGLLAALLWPWGGLIDLRGQLDRAETAAASHAASFDIAEGRRASEGRAAITDVEGERGSCAARIEALRAAYETQFDRLLEREPDAACPDDRGVRPIERVPDAPVADPQ